jgi:hypothetical protein
MAAEMVGLPKGATFSARDLWAGKDLGTFEGSRQFWLDPTGVVMLKIKALSPPSTHRAWA